MDIAYELKKRIATEPAILFLGQNYLIDSEGNNIFLTAAKQRGLISSEKQPTYDNLFLNNEYSKKDDFINELSRISQEIHVPDSIRFVAKQRWNCLFTSSVDTSVMSILPNSSRKVREVFRKDQIMANSLNPSNLHVVRLFGSITGENEEKQPPYDEFSKLLADNLALDLFRTIYEMIGRFGILVIEGYDPESDWLKPQTLYSALHLFHNNSIFMFSTNETFLQNPFISKLYNEGKLLLTEKSLSECLDYHEIESYEFDELNDPSYDSIGIYINNGVKYLERSQLLEVSGFCSLLDISILQKEHIPDYLIKDYFESFLRNSAIIPQWYAYQHSFNLIRDFEHDLYTRVSKILNNYSIDEKPILLSGQTGTGKSVAMGALAYKLFNERKFPIIYINKKDINLNRSGFDSYQRSFNNAFDALDKLIETLEDQGAETTVIIWDGSFYSSDIKKYFELQQELISRGRTTLLICTSYELPEDSIVNERYSNEEEFSYIYQKKFHVIKANTDISSAELARLRDILIKNIKIDSKKVERLINSCPNNNHFLIMLYYLFQDTHETLARGMETEANLNERNLAKLLGMKKNSKPELNAMVLALQKLPDFSYFIESAPFETSAIIESINRLTDIIAVYSQYNIDMPFDFALRLMGSFDFDIVNFLYGTTIFTVLEQEYGDYTIKIRTPLEAQLLLEGRGISIQRQVEYIKEIIKNISPKEYYGQTSEIEKVSQLIRFIGPNNKVMDNSKFQPFYPEIIDALKELRESMGIWDPRLILQEVSLIREYFRGESIPYLENTRIEKLQYASEIIQQVLHHLEKNRMSPFLKQKFLVEYASNQGSLMHIAPNNKDIRDYRNIRRTLYEAMHLDPSNYYAYDTFLWITKEERERTNDERVKYELLSEMCEIVDRIRTEDAKMAETDLFMRRAMEVKDLLKNEDISNAYFEELLQKGTYAGVYTRCQKILYSADIDFATTVIKSDEQKRACMEALELLEKYSNVTKHSYQCQYLLLRLKWLVFNGVPLFHGEKQCPKMSKEQWREIISICDNYEQSIMVDNFYDNSSRTTILYVKAIALASIGFINQSLEIFKLLKENRTIRNSRRIKTNHMLCNEDGTPIKFDGRILPGYSHEKHSGYITITAFKDPVYFYGPSLGVSDYSEGRFFDDIWIGFNFIGPVALRNIPQRRPSHE